MTADLTIIGRYEMQRLAEIVASKEPYAQTMSEQAYDEVCFVTHHLPRLVQMAEAHLSEPARLASAHAEGVRQGVEMAVGVIMARVNELQKLARETPDRALRLERLAQATQASNLATAIRHISPPPAEPTGGTAEPSAPVAEDE